MTQNADKVGAAVTGAALAAAAAWARYDDDTQRRIRNNRLDANNALDLIRDFQSSGQILRLRLPAVQDALAGIGIASAIEQPAVLLPGAYTPPTRPDLSVELEAAIGDMKWPPVPGEYDAHGMLKSAGELSSMFLAQTYEEVRAWTLGLVRHARPNRNAKIQIYFASHALASVLSSLNLTEAQYEDAWRRLFGQVGFPVNHADRARPPTLFSKDAGIASIVARGTPDLPGYPTPHNNTDQAQKWRITVGGANVIAGTTVAQFAFGAPYVNAEGLLVEPAVVASDGRFRIANVTPQGFQIINTQQLNLADIIDVSFVVVL